jgi:hypothetical protein
MNDLDHIDWSGIPGHCQDGLHLYFEQGVPLGGFLSAVISNDLKEACARADDINRRHIFEYVQFLYCYAPAPCWGSPEAYKKWIEKGGLKGREAA